MKILICPSGFKESLEPQQVADCIEVGIRRVLPQAEVSKVPIYDGGEGFAKGLTEYTRGRLMILNATGPVGEELVSHYGFLGGCKKKTAVIEMAAVAGLTLIPKALRNQTITTSYGVGELIIDAIEQGAEHIVMGCGDSGISDGGAGMLQALGARLLDQDGMELPKASGGASLLDIHKIDLAALHPLLRRVTIEAACNWTNVLCGPNGVARIYGPQKGATPEQVAILEAALNKYAEAVEDVLMRDIAKAPGSGASGGLGCGLMVLGATLRPRYDVITQYFGLGGLFGDCSLVLTAEGSLDWQTPKGKIPAEVGRRAKQCGVPVIALAGTIGRDAKVAYETGIDAFASILQAPSTLDEAIAKAEILLEDCAEATMRMVLIGWALGLKDVKDAFTKVA